MSGPLWDDDLAEGSLWSRSFDFDDGSNDDADKKTTLSLLVEEEWNTGIGGTCWEGGVLLARFLSSPSFAELQGQLPSGRPLRAIELGSGVSALPCLVAASLTRRGRRGISRRGERETANDESGGGDDDVETASSSLPLFSEIFATDIDECLPGLEANAVKNVPATTSVEVVKWEEGEGEGVEEGEEAKAKAEDDDDKGSEKKPQQALKLLDLDWRLFPRAATAFLRTPFDVVLVADAVYISGLMPALVEAMRCVCDEKSFVFLAYYLRSESADAQFWPRLRAAFEVEHIPARSFGCDGADRGDKQGLFRLRKRSEDDYRELERRRRRVEEEEEEGGEQEEEEEEEEGGEQEEEEEETK